MTAPSKFSRFSRIFWRAMGASAFVTIPITVFDKIGYPAVVGGSSMEPTLQGNDARWWKRDFVWLNRVAIQKRLAKGDVVVFVCPRDPKAYHVKRLVATEGDIVRPVIGPTSLVVPSGCCWMQSDNPSNHNDSNTYGPVASGLIIGRATRILWPPHRFGQLPPTPRDSLRPSFEEEYAEE